MELTFDMELEPFKIRVQCDYTPERKPSIQRYPELSENDDKGDAAEMDNLQVWFVCEDRKGLEKIVKVDEDLIDIIYPEIEEHAKWISASDFFMMPDQEERFEKNQYKNGAY